MQSVIIKPMGGRCNFACVYCYDFTLTDEERVPEPEKDIMSEATLTNALTRITKYANDLGDIIAFNWHGEEPLRAGLDFFISVQDKTDFLRSKGAKLKHYLQTNGSLLTEELVEFFVAHNFKLGFSLDGIGEINDATRKYPDGSGTFEDIMRGIRLYKSLAGVAGVITVVTKQNINHIEELYDFCKSEGIGLKLNPIECSGRAVSIWQNLAITPLEYARIVLKIYNKWLHDQDSDCMSSESVIEDTVFSILSGEPVGCVSQVSCQDSLISLTHKGEVYPCSRFDDNPNFLLGNVNDVEDFSMIAESPLRQYLRERAARVKGCLPSCNIYSTCNSGCMHQAYTHYGTIDAKDPFCLAYSLIQKTIKESVDSLLTKAIIAEG